MKTNIHFWSYITQLFLEWNMLQTKVVEKIKIHIYVMELIFENHATYEIMWKNIVELDRPKMTVWCICIACWIPNSTNTRTEYVIPIFSPLQQWWHTLHIHCLLFFNKIPMLFFPFTNPFFLILLPFCLMFLIFYFLNIFVESERWHNESYKEKLIFCTEQILNYKTKYKDIHNIIVILFKVCNIWYRWPLCLLALGAKKPNCATAYLFQQYPVFHLWSFGVWCV